jgi:hypothetical protein
MILTDEIVEKIRTNINLDWRSVCDYLCSLEKDDITEDIETWLYYWSKAESYHFESNISGSNKNLGNNGGFFYFKIFTKENDDLINKKIKDLYANVLDCLLADIVNEISIVVINPSGEVPRHTDNYPTGSYNLLLNLKVPNFSYGKVCISTVDGNILEIVNDKIIRIDPSVPHQAWNKTDDDWILLTVNINDTNR